MVSRNNFLFCKMAFGSVNVNKHTNIPGVILGMFFFVPVLPDPGPGSAMTPGPANRRNLGTSPAQSAETAQIRKPGPGAISDKRKPESTGKPGAAPPGSTRTVALRSGNIEGPAIAKPACAGIAAPSRPAGLGSNNGESVPKHFQKLGNNKTNKNRGPKNCDRNKFGSIQAPNLVKKGVKFISM